MRLLSGTAVQVDSTPNDMQVDLSPCQHLSLPTQSLIQRQRNRVWAYCVFCSHLNTHTHTLSIIHPFIHSTGPFFCVSPAPRVDTYRPPVLLCASVEGLRPDSSRCSGRSRHGIDPTKGLGTFNKTRTKTHKGYR